MTENRLDGTLYFGRFGLVIKKPKRNGLTVFRRPLALRLSYILQNTNYSAGLQTYLSTALSTVQLIQTR